MLPYAVCSSILRTVFLKIFLIVLYSTLDGKTTKALNKKAVYLPFKNLRDEFTLKLRLDHTQKV